ncbi:DinB family protein [Paenibacillus thalictri]|uniref:DinB family protein n=1 Tax=Paenibacillus thalictri TaxID=2527873 RepID=A0A4Q9DPX7_9BACL|nr:DinB family protein [Paenibacillus thalictri]TBL76388.1 DinB family protein [Paenibacillus thalictri]
MSQVDIQAYLGLHRQLVQAIEGLSEDQLKWKAKPESWSVIEVLTHLLDHNFVVSFRIRDILADTKVQLPAFDQDAWVSGQKANEAAVHEVLDAYKALLLNNSHLFGRLSPSDWEKSGVNFKGETVRVVDIVSGFIRHVHHHLGQIDRVKLAYAAGHAEGAGTAAP